MITSILSRACVTRTSILSVLRVGFAVALALAVVTSLVPSAAQADTFTLDVVRYQTPFTAKYRMKFSGDELKLETIPNLGPTPPVVVGRRE